MGERQHVEHQVEALQKQSVQLAGDERRLGEPDERTSDDQRQQDALQARVRHEEEQERPHQIELFLDRQRPEMREQGRVRELARGVEEVVGVGEPVHDLIAEVPERLQPRVRRMMITRLGEHERRHRPNHEKVGVIQRKDPEAAPAVEVQEVLPRRQLIPHVDQDGRQEKTGQHEERLDAKVAGGEQPHVIEKDRQEREKSERVEAWICHARAPCQ